MDPSGRYYRGCYGDKGAIQEDSRNKVLSVFDWKVKGEEQLRKPGSRRRVVGNTGRRTWWKSKMRNTKRFRSALQARS